MIRIIRLIIAALSRNLPIEKSDAVSLMRDLHDRVVEIKDFTGERILYEKTTGTKVLKAIQSVEAELPLLNTYLESIFADNKNHVLYTVVWHRFEDFTRNLNRCRRVITHGISVAIENELAFAEEDTVVDWLCRLGMSSEELLETIEDLCSND